MFRFVTTSVLGLATIVTLNAGQIQIGSSSGADGLTASYMSGATTSSCSGATAPVNPGFTDCVVPSGGVFFERKYTTVLFAGALPPAAVPLSLTDPTNGTTPTSGVTFNRLTDVNQDFWAESTALTSQIIVPVGIYGVGTAWTMLNDYWGGNGEKNTSVIFRFDDSSNGLGGTTAAYDVIVDLTNGAQIRSAVNCATPSACTTLRGGLTIATGLTSGATTINGVAVTASNIFSQAYTSGATGRYAGSTGNVVLDNQKFDFGLDHASEFLVSIAIRDQITAAYTGTGTTNTSNYRTALSAITVSQVPEPSTIFMALAGLGAVGYFRRRKA